MNDLISRAAAKTAIEKLRDDLAYEHAWEEADGVIEAWNVVNRIPAVDAVPVVRCKDCVDWRQEVNGTTHWVCTRISQNHKQIFHTPPDWYCARGERRENDA